MRGSGIVSRYYSGGKAEGYEAARSGSARWEFERESLESIFRDSISGVDRYEVIDVPIGTNRFFEFFNSLACVSAVHGVDLSDDMLAIARTKECHSYEFHKWDIVRSPLQFRAHVSVCFRFLNLFAFADLVRIIGNIAESTDRFIVLSVRLVETEKEGKIIENKVYLHQRNMFLDVVGQAGFKVVCEMSMTDNKPGTYYVLCLEREAEHA